MGRVKTYAKSLNLVTILYFLFTILVTFVLLFMVLTFESRFVNYQKEQTINLKEDISLVLREDDVVDNLTLLNNDYSFEVIVKDNNTVVYTSNSIYDIESANNVYNDNYAYKEVYEDNGYLIWLVVTDVNMVPFLNTYLVIAFSLVLLLIISTLVFLKILYNRSSKPIFRILQIIKELKVNNYTEVIFEEKLDVVSDELIYLYNDINLRSYYLKEEHAEYKRINKRQKSLLEEQKEYLETVVHDIKSPLSSINYSRYIIEETMKNTDESVEESLKNIKYQSEEALELVLEALITVRENSLDSFTEEDEIDVKEWIEKYFTQNSIIINKNKLKYNIDCEIEYLKMNRLKFLQIVNNLLSNMLNYAKQNTTLQITLKKDKFIFENESGNVENFYSTNYGSSRIFKLCEELGVSIEVEDKAGVYRVTIDVGDSND